MHSVTSLSSNAISSEIASRSFIAASCTARMLPHLFAGYSQRIVINPINPLPALGLNEYRDIPISVNL